MDKQNIQKVMYTINDINKNNVNLPSLNHNVEKVEEQIGFDKVFEIILEYISNKDIESLDSIIQNIDNVSSRTKTKESIKKKWDKNLGKKRAIKKVLNDIVGIRIVTDKNVDNIKEYIKTIADNEHYKIATIDFRENPKSVDDGYRGIHIYFMTNPKSFRIEIQIWSRIDAILNFYTHQNIYKSNGNELYALELRKWIDLLPKKQGFDFESYIWEIINNPSEYREGLAMILIDSIDLNKSLEDVLFNHYISLSKLDMCDEYVLELKEHLDNIPHNYEGIDVTFSEYVINRVIEEVV